MSGANSSGRWAIVPAPAVEDKAVGDAAFRVLACLSTYSDTEGWCWPSNETIAQRIGKTRQAVQQSLRLLQARGLIEVHPRRRSDGGDSSNKYRIVCDIERLPQPAHLAGGASSPCRGGKLTLQGGQAHLAPILERTQFNDLEATASGAGAPGAADPVKSIFDRGLTILGQRQRSLLGKYRKDYGDTVVLAAIVECENEQPSDPPAYFVACCERRGNGRRSSAEAGHARALDILAQAAIDFDERQSGGGDLETLN